MALQKNEKGLLVPQNQIENPTAAQARAEARLSGRLSGLEQTMDYTGKEGLAQSILDLNKKGLNKVYLGDSMDSIAKKIAYQKGAEAKAKADNQGFLGELKGFAVQAVVGEVVLGTVDGIAQLLDLPKWFDMLAGNTPDFDNWLSSWVQDAKESVREFAPIHVDPTKKGWGQLSDTAWWMNHGVSIASTVSLMIPAAGVARGAGMLGKLAKGAAVANAAARPAGTVAKILNTSNKLGEALPGLSKFSKEVAPLVLQAGVSRLTESSMEAAEVFRNRYDYYLNEKGMDEAKAREYASKGAAATFNADMGLILMDIAQYVSFARTFKASKMNFNSKVGELTRTEKLLKYPYKIATGSGNMIGEGFEEYYQYVQQEEGKHMADYFAGLSDKKGELGLTNLGEYLEDGEAWTSAFFGALGGKVFEKLMPKIQKGIAKYTGESFITPEEARLMESMEHTSRISKGLKQVNDALRANNPHAVRQAQMDMGIDMAIKAASQGNWSIARKRIEALKNGNQEKLKEIDPLMKEIGEVDVALVEEVLNIGDTVAKKYEDLKNKNKYHEGTFESIIRREILKDHNAKTAEIHGQNFINKKQEIASGLNLSTEETVNANTLVDSIAKTKAINVLKQILTSRGDARKIAEEKLKTKFDDSVSNRLQSAISKLENELSGIIVEDPSLLTRIKGQSLDEAIFEGSSQILSEVYKVINTEELNEITSKEYQTEYANTIEKTKKQIREERKKAKEKKKEEDIVNQATGSPVINEEDSVDDNPENLSDDDLADDATEEVNQTEDAANETDDVFDAAFAAETIADKAGNLNPDEGTTTTNKKANEDVTEPETTNITEDEFAKFRANIEEESFISQIPGLLAWRSFNNGKGTKESLTLKNKALTTFLENAGINLSEGGYNVVMSLNNEFISSSEFSKYNVAKEIKAYLENPIPENMEKVVIVNGKEYPLFSLIPMKATIVNSEGVIVNYQDFNMEMSLHDPDFFKNEDGSFRGEMGEIQYLELLRVKKEALGAVLKGKAVSYPINVHTRGKFNSKVEGGKFVERNINEALGIATENLTFVYGADMGGTGVFLNANGDANPQLLKYGGAKPGGIYTIITDNFGKSLPVRLMARNLDKASGEILYRAYTDLLLNVNKGKQGLTPALKKYVIENDTTGLVNVLNLDTITLNELIDFFVYQGKQTKGNSKIALFVERNHIVYDGMSYSATQFKESKEQFIEYIQTRLQQVKPKMLNNKAYKEYLINNNVVTTNLQKTATGGFFVQPVVGYNIEAGQTVNDLKANELFSIDNINAEIMSKYGVSQDIVNKMTLKDKESLLKLKNNSSQAIEILDKYKPIIPVNEDVAIEVGTSLSVNAVNLLDKLGFTEDIRKQMTKEDIELAKTFKSKEDAKDLLAKYNSNLNSIKAKKADIERRIQEVENFVNQEFFADSELLSNHWKTKKDLFSNKVKQLKALLQKGIKTGEDLRTLTNLLNDIRGILNEGININNKTAILTNEKNIQALADSLLSLISDNVIKEYIEVMNKAMESRVGSNAVEKMLVGYSDGSGYTIDGKNVEYFLAKETLDNAKNNKQINTKYDAELDALEGKFNSNLELEQKKNEIKEKIKELEKQKGKVVSRKKELSDAEINNLFEKNLSGSTYKKNLQWSYFKSEAVEELTQEAQKNKKLFRKTVVPTEEQIQEKAFEIFKRNLKSATNDGSSFVWTIHDGLEGMSTKFSSENIHEHKGKLNIWHDMRSDIDTKENRKKIFFDEMYSTKGYRSVEIRIPVTDTKGDVRPSVYAGILIALPDGITAEEVALPIIAEAQKIVDVADYDNQSTTEQMRDLAIPMAEKIINEKLKKLNQKNDNVQEINKLKEELKALESTEETTIENLTPVEVLATDMMNRLGVQFEIVDELNIPNDAQLAIENILQTNKTLLSLQEAFDMEIYSNIFEKENIKSKEELKNLNNEQLGLLLKKLCK